METFKQQKTVKNEILGEDNEEVPNESQIIESLRNFRKRKLNSIKSNDSFHESDDNDIEFSDNSETDVDYHSNEDIIDIESKDSEENSEMKQNDCTFSCMFEECKHSGRIAYLLEGHKKRMHSNEGQYKCLTEGCDKRFTFINDLTEHRKTVHTFEANETEIHNYSDNDCIEEENSEIERNDSIFICIVDGCRYRGRTAELLGRHKKRMHSNKRQYECSTEGCDNRYAFISDLTKHTQSVHTKQLEAKYVCDHIGCGKQFTTKQNLKDHKNIHCGDQYKCEWKDCGAVFAVKRYLDKHMTKHKGIFRCTHEGCQHRAGSASHLRTHEITHSEDKDIICLINDCNKRFKITQSLRKHQLRAHPQEFDDIPWINCSKNGCSFKTKSKTFYRKHGYQHTRPFVCTECQKGFKSTQALNTHLRSHFSELKIPCEWDGCERLFSTKQRMRDHMNTHTLEISHSCHWPNCDKIFIKKQSLYIHLQRHKGKGRYECPNCDYGSTNTIRFKNHLKKHEN